VTSQRALGARFITLEGGEGAGKSTQIARLASALGDAGVAVATTREPGGSPGADAIRRLLVEGEPGRWDGETEALLHFAARRDHLVRTVWPALATGRWVLCDRFADSTMAYQGYGHGLDRGVIEALYGLAVGDFRPDLTLILDLPVETGLARAAARHAAGNDGRTVEDRYERMDRGFHERLRAGFLDIAAREPDRCAVIDATLDADGVAAAIRTIVAARLGVALKGP
jgi:dTMP kinase